MRTLVFLLLVYLAYKAVKSWLAKNIKASNQRYTPGNVVDDEMIKDPWCDVYIPKRESVVLSHHGRQYHFCSNACRDKFLADETSKKRS